MTGNPVLYEDTPAPNGNNSDIAGVTAAINSAEPTAENNLISEPPTAEPSESPKFYGIGTTEECVYLSIFYRESPAYPKSFVVDEKDVVDEFMTFLRETDFRIMQEEELPEVREYVMRYATDIYVYLYDVDKYYMALITLFKVCANSYEQLFTDEAEYLQYITCHVMNENGERELFWFEINNRDDYSEIFEKVYTTAICCETNEQIREKLKLEDYGGIIFPLILEPTR